MSSELTFRSTGWTTIRAEYKVSPDDLVWALAWWYAQRMPEDAGPVSARQASIIVRTTYAHHGSEGWQTEGWADELTGEESDAAIAWAFAQVARNWPEVAAKIRHWRPKDRPRP